jgi:hypothetical protein
MRSEKITALQRANAWSQLVIGAAIEVHRIKGAGLLEEIYKKFFGRECELRNIPFVRELRVPLEYKGVSFEQPLRLDFCVLSSPGLGRLERVRIDIDTTEDRKGLKGFCQNAGGPSISILRALLCFVLLEIWGDLNGHGSTSIKFFAFFATFCANFLRGLL